MKKNWKNKLIGIGFLLVFILTAACGQKDSDVHAEGEEYTCPMHPQIVKNEPGACPICGMDLVKKGGTGSGEAVTEDLAYLIQPTNTTVVSTIETVHPEKKKMEVPVQPQGIITYDTRRIHNIAANYGGRIEKLYVKFNYQPVSKGQKLFDIYSPELVTAQEEFIFLLKNDPYNESLLEAGWQKLRLLGLLESQIETIARNRKADYTLTVYSPYNGYVVEDAFAPSAAPASTANSSSGNMGGMAGGISSSSGSAPANQGTATTANPSTSLSVQEGMYVTTGQTVFKVVNTDVVWAVFRVTPEELANIELNQSVTIVAENDTSRVVRGKVDFIEPFYTGNATLPAFRVYLPNSTNQLRIGNLVKGKMEIETLEALWVPSSAILDLGEKRVVFRKDDGVFKPVVVTTGQRAGGFVEIKEGLNTKDVIAINAQFLVDSESFVKVKSNE